MIERKIQVLTEQEIPGCAELEQLCFSEPWSENSLRLLLQKPYLALTALDRDGRVLGYVGMMIVLDEGQITSVAVHPKARRQGIAADMITALLRICREKELAQVTLEVRAGNAGAIALYEKCGFVSIGQRRGFYSHPREDAILMGCNLSVKNEERV